MILRFPEITWTDTFDRRFLISQNIRSISEQFYHQFIQLQETIKQVNDSMSHQKHSPPQLQSEQIPYDPIDIKYFNLTKHAINNNYQVSDLLPYSQDKVRQKVEKQLLNIQTKQPSNKIHQKQFKMILESHPVSHKIKQFIESTQRMTLDSSSFHNRLSKKIKIKFPSMNASKYQYYKTEVSDDYQALMEDYREEKMIDKHLQRETVKSINQKLITEYDDYILPASKDQQRKLIQFKKPNKVTKRYVASQIEFKQFKAVKEKNLLNLNKKDIGIYSRSANKALVQVLKLDKKEKEQYSEQKLRHKKSRHSYYNGYIQSYKSRHKILANKKIDVT